MNGTAPGAAPHLPEPGRGRPDEPVLPLTADAPWGREAARGGSPLALEQDLGLEPAIRWEPWARLLADRAAAVLRLRGSGAPEPVDLDPATRHVWIDDGCEPVAVLRVRQVLDDDPPGAPRLQTARHRGTSLLVENLAVGPDVRHLGLASALLRGVVARAGGRPIVADVPAEALALFARLDFIATATVLDSTDRLTALTRMRRSPDAPWREA